MSVDQIRPKDGVRLDGAWQKPGTPGKSQLPVDVMILNHGVADNFYTESPFEDFDPWLVAGGCAAIVTPSRTTPDTRRLTVPISCSRCGSR